MHEKNYVKSLKYKWQPEDWTLRLNLNFNKTLVNLLVFSFSLDSKSDPNLKGTLAAVRKKSKISAFRGKERETLWVKEREMLCVLPPFYLASNNRGVAVSVLLGLSFKKCPAE